MPREEITDLVVENDKQITQKHKKTSVRQAMIASNTNEPSVTCGDWFFTCCVKARYFVNVRPQFQSIGTKFKQEVNQINKEMRAVPSRSILYNYIGYIFQIGAPVLFFCLLTVIYNYFKNLYSDRMANYCWIITIISWVIGCILQWRSHSTSSKDFEQHVERLNEIIDELNQKPKYSQNGIKFFMKRSKTRGIISLERLPNFINYVYGYFPNLYVKFNATV